MAFQAFPGTQRRSNKAAEEKNTDSGYVQPNDNPNTVSHSGIFVSYYLLQGTVWLEGRRRYERIEFYI